jgi:hypothetical protein
MAPYYLYFTTLVQDGKTNFTTAYYDAKFQTQSVSIEEMLGNGMILRKLSLYQTDPTTGKSLGMEAKINNGAVFPFEVTDSLGVFVYNITLHADPKDTSHITNIIRNRRYIKDTTYTYQNKQYDAIVVQVRQVQDDDHKGHLEAETSATEIYAKGLGLVSIKRNVTKDLSLVYELKEVYTMEELEKKFAKKAK